MPQIKRAKPRRHFVIVDTNILWHRDKSVPVSPDFEAFWDAHSTPYNLSLAIPAVVRNELLYQQSTSACKALWKSREHLVECSSIAGKTYSHKVTDSQVTLAVERRLDTWISRRKATVLPTPVSDIDWQRLIDAAVWRKNVFSPDAKNPEAEKGFRDALILESLVAFESLADADAHVAFVCNDALLRAAAEERLKGRARASCFESLADFSSYLRLSAEKLTETFVIAIRSRARQKFFTINEPSCLYNASDVHGRVKTQHAAEFRWFGKEAPDLPSAAGTSLWSSLSFLESWSGKSREIVWLDNPTFSQLVGDRDFHWVSVLTFVQLFKREQGGLLSSVAVPMERLRILSFGVKWHAVVKADGRFQSMDVTSIEVQNRQFVMPTPDILSRYRVVDAPADQGAT